MAFAQIRIFTQQNRCLPRGNLWSDPRAAVTSLLSPAARLELVHEFLHCRNHFEFLNNFEGEEEEQLGTSVFKLFKLS